MFVDCEMTGLSPVRDRLIEIGLVRVEGGQEVARYQSLFRPGAKVNAAAQAVHGLSDAALSSAPTLADTLPEWWPLLEGAVWVGHNAQFDLGFLVRELPPSYVLDAPVLDTLLMARRLLGTHPNDLTSLSRRLGVSQSPTHRALADALATRQVFEALWGRIDPNSELTLGALDDLLEALAPDSPARLLLKARLEAAYRQRRTVHLTYRTTADPQDGTTDREVAIWKLRSSRLQGWCYLREAERVFRQDRVQAAEIGDRSYEIPVDFSPRI